MAKSSENIVLKRVEEISRLLIKGAARDIIVQYSSENWSIGERQVDKYIQRAKELIEHSVIRNVNYDYSKAIRRYEELYRLSMDGKEYKTAAQINKELAALQGLYKLQIEHSGSVQFICNLP